MVHVGVVESEVVAGKERSVGAGEWGCRRSGLVRFDRESISTTALTCSI
jgi:hypothetical protein